MKIYWLIALLCILVFDNSFARIRNGYERQRRSDRRTLQDLVQLAAMGTVITAKERRNLTKEIDYLIDRLAYYELTKSLIKQLKEISPDIYFELDRIRDRRGRSTDVYVRVISKQASRYHLSAASFFERSTLDEDANHSEYGEFSVSIDLWISGSALIQLAHELGHVKYIVPNLAAYSSFYRQRYPTDKSDVYSVGHGVGDLSGEVSREMEMRFRSDRWSYVRREGRAFEKVFSMLKSLRTDIRDDYGVMDNAIASNGR